MVTFEIEVGTSAAGQPPPHFTITYLRPPECGRGRYPAKTSAPPQPGLVPETIVNEIERILNEECPFVDSARRKRMPVPACDTVVGGVRVAEGGPIHRLRVRIDEALRAHGGGFAWASTCDGFDMRTVHCTAGVAESVGRVAFREVKFSTSLAPIAPNLALHAFVLSRGTPRGYQLANLIAKADWPIAFGGDVRTLSGATDGDVSAVDAALVGLAREQAARAAPPPQPPRFPGGGRTLGGAASSGPAQKRQRASGGGGAPSDEKAKMRELAAAAAARRMR